MSLTIALWWLLSRTLVRLWYGIVKTMKRLHTHSLLQKRYPVTTVQSLGSVTTDTNQWLRGRDIEKLCIAARQKTQIEAVLTVTPLYVTAKNTPASASPSKEPPHAPKQARPLRHANATQSSKVYDTSDRSVQKSFFSLHPLKPL